MSVQRKLAAIFSADVEGYSRLMGEDEAATVRTLTAYRDTIATRIEQHRGRVVDAPGDNLLAEFSSVVDAVQCAVEVQQALRDRNTRLPDDRRMRFRIGINLGDLIVEGERIYGDGVNIAARVQGLAEAGGIAVSGTAYDQVKNKLALEYESLGAHHVKNIAEAVRVYRVRTEPGVAPPVVTRETGARLTPRQWTVVAVLTLVVAGIAGAVIWQRSDPRVHPAAEGPAERAPALELPDKPSVAVLPFVNMSDDPEQEYFSDGITEDLITDLAKVSGLVVIARNSTFAYKGTPVNVGEVSRELGVRYVLEGSVRKAGDRVRVTAMLVDATTGHHVWADRYDRELRDVFALQDEIAERIVTALAVTLTEGEQERLQGRGTANPEAYDSFLRGSEYYRRATRQANLRARQMFERAATVDPEYADAYTWLGWTYFRAWTLQWSQEPETLERALELAQRCRRLDETLAACHLLLAQVSLWQKRHDEAIAEAEQAVALAPNDADTYEALGEVLTFAGKPEEAIGLVKRAMRLNPRYPIYYPWALGHAYYLTGRREEAIVLLKGVLTRNPDWVPAHVYLAAAYAELGRTADARAALAEVLRLSPEGSADSLRRRLPYKDPAVLQRLLESLRAVGLAGWREALVTLTPGRGKAQGREEPAPVKMADEVTKVT